MSSREFLVLLDELPDRSRYKGALRGFRYGVPYEWSQEEYMQSWAVRELVKLTGSNFDGLHSPAEQRAIDIKKAAEAENRRGAKSVIHAGLYRKVRR